MAIIDVHSHWGTKRGYPLQTEVELAQQRATWNSEPKYHTEAEMAQYFRDSGVNAICRRAGHETDDKLGVAISVSHNASVGKTGLANKFGEYISGKLRNIRLLFSCKCVVLPPRNYANHN